MINQYLSSPRIMALSEGLEGYLDVDASIDEFYNIVWNVDTAQGFGLDIWGRIVGLKNGRYLQVPASNQFGFHIAATGALAQPWAPFDQGTFASSKNPSGNTQTYALQDNAFRTLILAKAMTNIVATTSPAINQVLNLLFAGRGNCYVNDLGNMQMRYTFEFELQPWEAAIIASGVALPRPAGVLAFSATIPRGSTFGFAEQGAGVTPFNQGTFLSDTAVQTITA